MTNYSNPADQAAFNVKQRLMQEQLDAQVQAEQAAQNVVARLKGSASPELKSVGASGNNVYDGDTINGRRLSGGNTPELKTNFDRGSAMPLSIEARDRADELIESGRFAEQVSAEKGQKGRNLANWVAEDGSTLMQQLLSEGYAAPMTGFDENGRGLDNEKAYAQALSEFDKTGSTYAMRNQVYDYGQIEADPDAKLYDRRTFAGRAWDRGTDLMQMNLFQASELIGRATGVNVIEEWGEEGVIRNMHEAAMSPAEIESTDDIETLSDLGKYIIERGVENAPNFLADLGVAAGAAAATALTGGVAAPLLYAAIGKQFVGKLGWKAAGKFGLGASMYAQMAGESRHTQLAAGVDNPLLALGTGAVNTGLEYYGLQSILKGFMPKGKITNAAGLAKHIGKQAAINTGIEGSTEWLQGLTNQLAIKMAKPEHEIDWHELTESFFAGMAAGGGTSTVGATAGGTTSYLLEKSRMKNLDTNTVPETPASVQAQVDEVVSTETPRDTAAFPQKESLADVTIPDGVIVSEHADGSAIVTTDAAKAELHKEQGMDAAKELRGYQKSKQEIIESGEEQHIVTRHNEAGDELSSEVVTATDAPAALANARAEAKPTDKVGITKADQTKIIKERQAELEKIDAQNKSQADVERDISNPTPLSMPQAAEEAAPKEVNRQDLTPVPEAEQGTASILNENDELRPVAELIHDYTTGKLSAQVVREELQNLGVNPDVGLDVSSTAIDRKATIDTLLNAGVKADQLMHPKDDARAKRNPYRNAKDILVDNSISDQDLMEMAKQHGVTPTEQADFHEKKMIAKIVAQLTQHRSQLPDDLRQAAFLFNNTKEELVRDTTHTDFNKHQKRGVFIAGLNPVLPIRPVLEAHLDTFNSADGIDTNDRKLELVRIANVLGVTVSAKEQLKGPPLKVTERAQVIKRIQMLDDAYLGVRQKPILTAAQEQDRSKDKLSRKRAARKKYLARQKERNRAAGKNKAVLTEKRVQEIEAAMKNYDLGDIPEDDAQSADGIHVDDDMRRILEEARAKAFDIAIVQTLLKAAGIAFSPKTLLDNWAPKNEALNSVEAKQRIEVYAESRAAKDYVHRELGSMKQYAAMVDVVLDHRKKEFKGSKGVSARKGRLIFDDLKNAVNGKKLDGQGQRDALAAVMRDNGVKLSIDEFMDTSDSGPLKPIPRKAEALINRLRKVGSVEASIKILEGLVINKLSHEYDVGELDGERPAALSKVTPEEERKNPVNVSGFGNNNPEVDPATASENTFRFRLGTIEVRVNEAGKTIDSRYTFGVLRGKGPEAVTKRTEHTESTIHNTERTAGKNLVAVIKADPSGVGKAEPIHMDAVRLAQMGLGHKAGAETTAVHTLGDVLAGLYAAIDRMGVMPESFESKQHVTALYHIDVSSLSDDLVIHFNADGNPVTLGEAKAMDHKLNPDNPSWKRGLNREDIQNEVDPLNRRIGQIYRRLLAKLKSEPNNTELRHAVSWIEGQMDRYSDNTTEEYTPSTRDLQDKQRRGKAAADNSPKGIAAREVEAAFLDTTEPMIAKQDDWVAFDPARKESEQQRLERVAAENKAIRKIAPEAKQITDHIVGIWNHARTEQFDDRWGYAPDEVQIQGDVKTVDHIDDDRGRVGERDTDAPNFAEEHEQFDPKMEQSDPDAEAVAKVYGDGVTTNEKNLAASRAADQRTTDAKGAPSVQLGSEHTTELHPKAKGTSKSTAKVDMSFKPKNKATFLGKAILKRAPALKQLLDYVHSSKLGLKLPLVIIGSSDLNAKALPELDAATIKKLRDNMDGGHNGAFLSMGSYGIIVIKDTMQGTTNKNTAAVLAIASHEIGHAIFESMTTQHQQVIEKAYRDKTNEVDGQTIDGAEMREWVADQVAHYIAARGMSALKGTGNEFTKAIAKIADALIGFWREATRSLMKHEVFIDFAYYFESVTSERTKAFRTTIPNTDLYNLSEKEVAQKLRATGAKAKQSFKGGWRPITQVLRSVYSRVSDYSKALSAELYQKSQTKGAQAYEQLQRFLHDEMQGSFAKLEQRIGEKAMKQAFADLRAGKLTANARAVRSAITKVNQLLKAHVPTMHFRDNFMPEAFDHAAIEKNRAAFEKMLVDAKIVSSNDVHTMVQDLLYSEGMTDYAVAPGKAVSTHQSVNNILSVIGSQKLMEAGFLLDNPHAIMSHYIATSAKRAAWEFKFGGYTDQYQGDVQLIRYRLLTQAGYDVAGMSGKEAEALTLKTGLEKGGKFYSPNHRIQQYMEQIKSEYGDSGVKQVKELLDSALGRLGHDIPSPLRTSFEWVTTWMNLTLLAFSGVASIPELAGSVIRARGQLSLADFVDVVKDLPQARQFATDLGIILTDGAEQMALETMGAQYSSPLQHKISQVFFKVNGQQFITRLSRTMALSTGKRFMLNAAQRVKDGDTAAADELAMIHIDAKTVNQWVADGMPNDNMAVNKALNQFVYESSIKPSKFEATKWGNNPYWKLAWHLKQFFYSFGTVIVGGIARHTYQKYQEGVKNGNVPAAAALMASTPLLIAGLAFLPLAGLSEELRELIKGTNRTDKMGNGEYAKHLFSKTGGLGPFEMVSSMYRSYGWNNSVIASLTPVTGFAETMISADVSSSKKLQRVIPFYSQNVLSGLYK